MKVFTLRDMMVGENGFFKPEERRKTLFGNPVYPYISDINQILIFAEENMYVTEQSSKKVPELLGNLAKNDTDAFRLLDKMDKIELRNIRKVLMRPFYTLPYGTLVNNQLQFYRALHVDTACKMEISSLWLMNKEVVEILSGHILKPGVRSDLEQINDCLVPRKRANAKFSEDPERYPLGDEIAEWDEENKGWKLQM